MDLSGHCLLVADRDGLSRHLICQALQEAGAQVHELDNPATAATTCQRTLLTGQRFDLLLIDPGLPDLPDSPPVEHALAALAALEFAPRLVLMADFDAVAATGTHLLRLFHAVLWKPVQPPAAVELAATLLARPAHPQPAPRRIGWHRLAT